MDKQQKDQEQSRVHSSSTETLHSVYLHSDDSINVNLTEKSKWEMEYFESSKQSKFIWTMFLWISNQEKKDRTGY